MMQSRGRGWYPYMKVEYMCRRGIKNGGLRERPLNENEGLSELPLTEKKLSWGCLAPNWVKPMYEQRIEQCVPSFCESNHFHSVVRQLTSPFHCLANFDYPEIWVMKNRLFPTKVVFFLPRIWWQRYALPWQLWKKYPFLSVLFCSSIGTKLGSKRLPLDFYTPYSKYVYVCRAIYWLTFHNQ